MVQENGVTVDIKSAVKKAKEYLADFFPEEIDTIRLEETELNEDGTFWRVTLSFLELMDPSTTIKSPFSNMFEGSVSYGNRIYKSLRVRASDGEVLGMTIWKA